VAQAEADWAAQFSALTANAAAPLSSCYLCTITACGLEYQYGLAYRLALFHTMYTDFISQAYANNYEFVTVEDLASRVQAEQKAISTT